MKFLKITGMSLGAVAISIIYTSCYKNNFDTIAPVNYDLSNKALVQIYNGIVTSTRNYVYVDGSAVTGATLGLGSTFPSTPSNFSVNQGFREFLVRDTLPTATQLPLSFAQILQPGSYYTIFLYDTITSPKQKIVNNNIVIPADTTARVRFANFVFSKTAVPNVDLYSVKRAANLFTNVAVTDVTGYIPFNAARNTTTADTLLVRETGTTNLLAQLNAYMPISKRSYTLVFRGRYLTTSGTAARTLSSFSSN